MDPRDPEIGDTLPSPPPSFQPSSPIGADKTFDEFDGLVFPLDELEFDDE